MLAQKLETTFYQHKLAAPRQHLLLAVSGGADSIAMLHLMHALARKFAWRLSVAHLHHGLRDAEADADAKFVGQTAAGLHLPCTIARRNVRLYAQRHKLSLEAAARAVRYDFLERTAIKLGCDAIVTAHTADDHIETILLKFLRGAGARGLAGISRMTTLKKTPIIRPLRDIWRKELLAYLRRHGHAWREDSSNASRDFLRNRIRHDLLPLLEQQFNPSLRQTLWRLGEIMAEEDHWLENLITPIYQQCRAAGSAATSALNCELMQIYPLAVKRRVLRRWLTENHAPTDFATVQRLEKLLHADAAGRASILSNGKIVRRVCAWLQLAERKQHVLKKVSEFKLRLTPGGIAKSPQGDWQISMQIEPTPNNLATGKNEALLSARQWRQRILFARNWRPGDRMRPFGFKGSRKLQDIFTDLKRPPALRRALPVITCGDEIVWVPGYRIAQNWAVQSSDRRVVRLRFIHKLPTST